MIFQEFDKKNKDHIRNLREQKMESRSSSSVWHAQYTVDEGRKLASVHERGQEQERDDKLFGESKEEGLFSEKKEGGRESRMQEIFHTENAFARISLGMNEKGKSVLVTSRKMRADVKSTERSERELDEQRSYNWHVVGGDDKANYNNPAESAFGFYQNDRGELEPHTRAHRSLSRSQEFANLTGNRMTGEFIPSKSSAVGETKELTARELSLEHQLAIALERGKKKMEENQEIIPMPIWDNEEMLQKLDFMEGPDTDRLLPEDGEEVPLAPGQKDALGGTDAPGSRSSSTKSGSGSRSGSSSTKSGSGSRSGGSSAKSGSGTRRGGASKSRSGGEASEPAKTGRKAVGRGRTAHAGSDSENTVTRKRTKKAAEPVEEAFEDTDDRMSEEKIPLTPLAAGAKKKRSKKTEADLSMAAMLAGALLLADEEEDKSSDQAKADVNKDEKNTPKTKAKKEEDGKDETPGEDKPEDNKNEK